MWEVIGMNTKIWEENLEERDHWRLWIGFMRLKIGTSGGLL
jgi:hypothetical protein